MNNKNIILRTSNEIGNQMFMYASAFSISKKMKRNLLIDNESAFLSKKNISNYGLNNFKISAQIANNNLKYTNLSGYLKRKYLKKTDYLRKKKYFYIEPKNKKKITFFNNEILSFEFSDNLFLEGHFESEKYFFDYKKEIINEFEFFDAEQFIKNRFFSEINDNNSVGICLRQNRFAEGQGKKNNRNMIKSQIFTQEQVNFINKSVEILKERLTNPIFYIWSNDLKNINFDLFNFDFRLVDLSKNEKNLDIRALSLFLLSKCKHFITVPSTFSWWGAWLSKNNNKIILRPTENCFSEFLVNNKDFWPSNWLEVSVRE